MPHRTTFGAEATTLTGLPRRDLELLAAVLAGKLDALNPLLALAASLDRITTSHGAVEGPAQLALSLNLPLGTLLLPATSSALDDNRRLLLARVRLLRMTGD